MRLLFPIIVMALSGVGLANGADAFPDRPFPPVDVHTLHFDYMSMLESGAGIYVCNVTKVEPVEGQDPTANIQRGKATLKVTETMWGPSRTEIVLPYYAMDAHDLFYAWDMVPRVSSDQMIYIVLSNGYDKDTPQYPDIHEALIGNMRYERYYDQVKAQLKDHVTKLFAQPMTLEEFTQYSRATASHLIEDFARYANPKEIIAQFGLFNSIFNHPQCPEQVDASVCRVLAALAQDQTPDTRQPALAELAIASTSLTNRFHVQLSDCLNKEGQDALLKAVNAEAAPKGSDLDKTLAAIRSGLGK